MQCPQCHYLRKSDDGGPDTECPRCGIIYAKFDPKVEQKRDELRKIGERRLYHQARAESISVNAQEAKSLKGRYISPRTLICPSCGSLGRPMLRRRGSGGIELVLWVCLIVPGIIYSLWRMLSPMLVCADCEHHPLIKVGSPIGRQQFADLYPEKIIK